MSTPSELAVAALKGLEPFFADLSPSPFTQDEAAALNLVKEALQDIAAGGDLTPAAQGSVKMRLIRRVEVRYFHPLAPRKIEHAPEPAGPVAVPGEEECRPIGS